MKPIAQFGRSLAAFVIVLGLTLIAVYAIILKLVFIPRTSPTMTPLKNTRSQHMPLSPTASLESAPPSDWKVYVSHRYGYAFAYPPIFHMVPEETSHRVSGYSAVELPDAALYRSVTPGHSNDTLEIDIDVLLDSAATDEEPSNWRNLYANEPPDDVTTSIIPRRLWLRPGVSASAYEWKRVSSRRIIADFFTEQLPYPLTGRKAAIRFQCVEQGAENLCLTLFPAILGTFQTLH